GPIDRGGGRSQERESVTEAPEVAVVLRREREREREREGPLKRERGPSGPPKRGKREKMRLTHRLPPLCGALAFSLSYGNVSNIDTTRAVTNRAKGAGLQTNPFARFQGCDRDRQRVHARTASQILSCARPIRAGY